MPGHQHRQIIINLQGNRLATEINYPIPTGPEYSNIVESTRKILKINHVKTIQILREAMNTSLKEI